MIGTRIKKRRTELDLNAAELARQAGISKGYLYSIEEGTTQSPSGEIVYALALALGTTVADLLGFPEPTQFRDVPEPLRQFADEYAIPPVDIYMLSNIHFRGKQPASCEDYWFIYEAIKRTIVAP